MKKHHQSKNSEHSSTSTRSHKSGHKQHERFPRERTAADNTTDLKYVLHGIPRLDLSKIKKNKPLIEDFVLEGTTQVGYGKFGTRKTTLHLLAAWAVSQGIPFLGKKTRKRMILYLDYENPAGVLKSYCKDLGINPDDPYFTIWDRSKKYPPVAGDKRLEKFIRRCKKKTGRYPWIIFDSWTSLLRSGDSGNAIGEAKPIFEAIRRYCDMGATCTIIDHVGHKGEHPIGTTAKMTQMDTAHLFRTQSDQVSLDGRSSRAVIRIENYLKRFAPKSVGTFSIEIKAAMDDKDEWHTISVEPTKDKSLISQEWRITKMQQLIQSNPRAGKDALAELASRAEDGRKKIMGRDSARALLTEGHGKHWEIYKSGSKKELFRLLKSRQKAS